MWDEPAGMTMVEAIVSGLPLITTNSGGIPEYIPRELAVILERDDDLVENISTSIIKIKKNGNNHYYINDAYKKFIYDVNLHNYYNNFKKIINDF